VSLAGVLAQGGVEDRNRLRQGQGQVEEQGALPGFAGRLEPEFTLAFRGGLRLGSQQTGVQVGCLLAAGGRTAQGRTVRSFSLTEQELVFFTVDLLARGEAERLCAGAPPTARGLAAVFGWIDVIGGRVLCQGRVYLLPDVVQVVALAQSADDCQGLPPPAGGGGTVHGHRVVHGCDEFAGHDSMVTKRASKII
jgi:hypothetical protein